MPVNTFGWGEKVLANLLSTKITASRSKNITKGRWIQIKASILQLSRGEVLDKMDFPLAKATSAYYVVLQTGNIFIVARKVLVLRNVPFQPLAIPLFRPKAANIKKPGLDLYTRLSPCHTISKVSPSSQSY